MGSAAALVSPIGPASCRLSWLTCTQADRADSDRSGRRGWVRALCADFVGYPPFRGVSAHARPRRVAPDVTASRPEALRRLRFNKFRLIHGFHRQVGSYSRTERTAGDTARRADA